MCAKAQFIWRCTGLYNRKSRCWRAKVGGRVVGCAWKAGRMGSFFCCSQWDGLKTFGPFSSMDLARETLKDKFGEWIKVQSEETLASYKISGGNTNVIH